MYRLSACWCLLLAWIPTLAGASACGGGVAPAPEPQSTLELKGSASSAEPTASQPAVDRNATLEKPVGPAPPSVGPPVHNQLVPSMLAGACVIVPGGELRCLGGDTDRHAPPGKFISIEHSKSVYCGVRMDQSAVCWSFSGEKSIPITLPEGKFAALFVSDQGDARRATFCGIRPAGDVDCWQLLPGQGSSVTLRPIRQFSGKFVQVLVSSSSFRLLDADGQASEAFGSFAGPPRKALGGNFTEIGDNHRVRSDGAFIDMSFGTNRVVPGAFVSGDDDRCVLSRDGSVSCDKRFYPGPFVQIKNGCGIRLDGRLKAFTSNACASSLVAEVPEPLRARIQVPSERLAVAHFNRFEKLRAVEGTAREYRVSFSSRSEDYLVAERRGAIMTSVSHDPRGANLLDEDNDFTLVDINGGEIQLGDPAYIKRGDRYLAPGAGAEHRLELLSQSSPQARWTIHAFDRNAKPEEPFPPVSRRGLANVLLRASATGEFLLPCPAYQCAKPPAHSGVRPAGARSDIGPWWVTDPYWSDVDGDDAGQHLIAGWTVMALVDCEATDPWTHRRTRFRCETISE